MTGSPPRRPDVRLYLVTGDVGPRRRLVDVVRSAVDGGVTLVQLRDKDAGPSRLAELYAEVRDAIAGSGVPVLLNDDADTAEAVRADGLHVGPDDLAPVEARRRLGHDAVIGWSIHRVDQLREAAQLAAAVYVAASPVWPTPTKTDTTEPLGLTGVTQLRSRMPEALPLVAIGGIGPGNAASVIAAGADGVAVVSAICGAEDPEAAARSLRTTIDRALDVRPARATSQEES
ncbi:MAG: thiamine phosphate synthase [Nocardioidaceae bacterium]